MKKGKLKERVYTVAFMLAATLIATAAVSGLHLATKETVRRNADLFRRRAILRAANIPLPGTPEEISSAYDSLVKPVTDIPDCYTVGPQDEKCVFLRKGPGLWGDITAVVCFETRTGAIVGVTFTEQQETPGLGGRIEEEWFQSQFKGKTAPLELLPEGSKSEEPDKIDAITGASITSEAVRDIVNAASKEAAAMAELIGSNSH